MKKINVIRVAILLSCCHMVGMQEEKKALENKKDRKQLQDLGRELHKCHDCGKYNAIHGHPDIFGFMCTDCSNKRAELVLAIALGAHWS